MDPITSGAIGGIVGTIISLAMLLLPKLNVWYASKTADYKKAFMLWVGIIVSVGIGVISCANLYVMITCDVNGLVSLVGAFLGYAVGNQSVYRLSPEPKAVKAVKLGK